MQRKARKIDRIFLYHTIKSLKSNVYQMNTNLVFEKSPMRHLALTEADFEFFLLPTRDKTDD